MTNRRTNPQGKRFPSRNDGTTEETTAETFDGKAFVSPPLSFRVKFYINGFSGLAWAGSLWGADTTRQKVNKRPVVDA